MPIPTPHHLANIVNDHKTSSSPRESDNRHKPRNTREKAHHDKDLGNLMAVHLATMSPCSRVFFRITDFTMDVPGCTNGLKRESWLYTWAEVKIDGVGVGVIGVGGGEGDVLDRVSEW
jgi:hypothetical protein